MASGKVKEGRWGKIKVMKYNQVQRMVTDRYLILPKSGGGKNQGF